MNSPTRAEVARALLDFVDLYPNMGATPLSFLLDLTTILHELAQNKPSGWLAIRMTELAQARLAE